MATATSSLSLLLRLPASIFAIAFTGQRLINAEFLAGLQVKGVPFDFADDVLLNNLPLEAAESVLNRLAVLEPYLSQMAPPRLTAIPMRFAALTARHDPADGIIWYLPASAPCQLAPAFGHEARSSSVARRQDGCVSTVVWHQCHF
jgi:hypothetical protein